MRSVVIGPEFDYDVYMSHVVVEREYVIIDLMQPADMALFSSDNLYISSPSFNISMMLVFLRRISVEFKFGKWRRMVPLLTCRGFISLLSWTCIDKLSASVLAKEYN
jgi:hypothetical protein